MVINIYADSKNLKHSFFDFIPKKLDYRLYEYTGELIDNAFYLIDSDFFFLQNKQKIQHNLTTKKRRYRYNKANYSNENLLKSVKSSGNKTITDLTCGLALDSFLLHQKGYKIQATENNPIIFLITAFEIYIKQQINFNSFQLIYSNCYDYLLNANSGSMEIIYADPMFSLNSLKGKVNKDINFLRSQAKPQDFLEILLLAKTKSEKLIVKMPIKEKPYTELGIYNHALTGKNTIFYIYI